MNCPPMTLSGDAKLCTEKRRAGAGNGLARRHLVRRGAEARQRAATLEAELLSRRRFASQAEAKMACFSYIEGWYNPLRLHSGLGYRSPITYEADMQAAMTKT
jgi:transposase InsO family protein